MNPFLGEECAAAKDARILLVPVPYERTTTFHKGTAAGPAALLAASEELETFDEETQTSPRAATLDPVTCDGMPDELAELLESAVSAHGRHVVGCLGGEHSLSLGPIRAAARAHPGLGVLQIDAHPDLREAYEGTRYGHGCVMRRVLELREVATLVQVGLRSVSKDDDAVFKSDARVRPFYARDLARGGPWAHDVVGALPQKVYLSFDLDGLDPSVIPGTGTPEPGGLGWWEALALLRAVIERRELVGFDVVELIPDRVSSTAAAHLVFKILAYLEQAR